MGGALVLELSVHILLPEAALLHGLQLALGGLRHAFAGEPSVSIQGAVFVTGSLTALTAAADIQVCRLWRGAATAAADGRRHLGLGVFARSTHQLEERVADPAAREVTGAGAGTGAGSRGGTVLHSGGGGLGVHSDSGSSGETLGAAGPRAVVAAVSAALAPQVRRDPLKEVADGGADGALGRGQLAGGRCAAHP